MSIELLKQRVSVRKYEPRPVETEKIQEIVAAARYAPTARNEQPWELIVVTDAGRREKLAGFTDYGKFIAEAPVCIAVFCHDTQYYLEDGSAVSTYILLAATAVGLGSCWIAGDKKAYADQVRELLQVPAQNRLVSLISLGYPAEHHPKNKRTLNEMLHWEKF
jgi:nitroreductase